jgi:hypothetical protein
MLGREERTIYVGGMPHNFQVKPRQREYALQSSTTTSPFGPQSNQKQNAQALLDAGAKDTVTDTHGATALHYAAQRGACHTLFLSSLICIRLSPDSRTHATKIFFLDALMCIRLAPDARTHASAQRTHTR